MNSDKLIKLKTLLGIVSITLSVVIFCCAILLYYTLDSIEYDRNPLLSLMTLGLYDIIKTISNFNNTALNAALDIVGLGIAGGIFVVIGGVITITTYKSTNNAFSIFAVIVVAILHFTFTAFAFYISNFVGGFTVWILLGLFSLIIGLLSILLTVKSIRQNKNKK